MFEALGERLTGVFDRLTGRGVLSEKDVDEALREVRLALLDADVALPVVRDFIAKAREEATGEAVIKSVRPADQVVKIVHDGLADMLGEGTPSDLNLNVTPPSVILMAGLQGSGKTTTSAKLAVRLKNIARKRVMMASLDTRRPAAMEQLASLGRQAEVDVLPIIVGQSAPDIARRALTAAKLGGYDVLILDTAGRTTLDEQMMGEAAEIAAISRPTETLLVADALTGQDAVKTAKAFHERLPLTGLVLTRTDGDSRGGAALSMRHVTGLPIKFLGSGEKIDALEPFDARRMAGRILGAGDVVALVEKAVQEIDQADAERMAKKMAKGQFDLEDLANQLKQMQKMGGVQGIMGLLPGVQKVKKQLGESGLAGAAGDKMFARQGAIISSMTPTERRKPDLLNASRKRRIAAGSGVDVAEVNRLLKQHRQMADMFKMMSKGGGRGMAQMAAAMGGMGGGGGMGGMPRGVTPPGGMPGMGGPGGIDLEKLKALGGGKLPPGLGGGAPGGFPGLGGLPGFKKK
jgi:signal recognition particle subunit SRP54